MKKTLVAILCASFVLIGCGSSATSATTAELITDDNAIENNNSDLAEVVVEKNVSETDSTETATSEEAVVEQSGHKKLDSDVMEYYAINMSGYSEDSFEYDNDGNVVKIVTTDMDGNSIPYLEMSYDTSGRVSEMKEYSQHGAYLIYSFKRNDKGQKIETNTQVADSNGGFNSAGRITTEYDKDGKRVSDHPYTSDGQSQGSYTEYQYDEQGRRVGIQKKNSDTDEVLSNEVYEYDNEGRLTNAYSYFGGAFVSRKEYIYDSNGFDHMVLYSSADDQTGVTSTYLLLPNHLYEVLDY